MKIDLSDIKEMKNVEISANILNYRELNYIPNCIYDISPLQYASYSGWIYGVKIILDHNVIVSLV